MEEKRNQSETPPPEATSVSETPAAEAPTNSRRRGGGQKRKASAITSGSTSTPSTTSSKRQAREKLVAVPFPSIQNGPLTRARQQPNNSGAAAAAALASGVKIVRGLGVPRDVGGGEAVKAEHQLNEVAKEDWEALEAKIEAECEAIRSRGANVHVVPNHAGWFSWTKIHPLEEKTLPSFFNGKLENRTPEIYMEMRNWIMKKFHADPSTQIELKDLSEISIGELEARQEVMEFLDYWGLINYHPFPKTNPTPTSIDDDADKAAKTDSLLESLFRFESEQSCIPVVPRNVATLAAPSGLFPESSMAEELIKSEGPAVEYHCNSCSADCSRTRYHCQKQADFDLCTECFSNGKFGSDMSPSDFILMEPAEAGGASSGKWTDQETLLLLEALELFKENWNEIAEHVATKTKAQCILHFVQMPIEDTFFDSGDEIDSGSKENVDAILGNNDTSDPKDAAEMTENTDTVNDNQPSSSPVENSKPEEVNGSNTCEASENFVMKALTEAFEAVGCLPSSDERLSFAEAGNPVMTLAAFLVSLVEPNTATISARNSLKFISGNSSSDQLAARHCFSLEDPPNQKKPTDSERTAAEMVEEETPKEEEQNVEKQEEKSNLVVDGVSASNDEDNESNKERVIEEEGPGHLASPGCAGVDESASFEEAKEASTDEVPEPASGNDSADTDMPKEQLPGTAEGAGDLAMEVEVPPGFEREPEAEATVAAPSESSVVPKEKDEMHNSGNKDPLQPIASNSVDENGANKDAEAEDFMNDEKCDLKTKNEFDHEISKIKKAAVTTLSAATVKAKLLANQEEEQIHKLAALLIEKQLHKLELKLSFFNEMENMVMRVREQLERSKQKLFHERAQIIAARLGISSSRPMQQSLPVNRAAMAFASSVPRPIIGVSPRPPVSRPIMISNPAASSFLPATVGGSVHPSNQEQLPSVSTK